MLHDHPNVSHTESDPSSYPPIMKAVRDDSVLPITDSQSAQRSLDGSKPYRPYEKAGNQIEQQPSDVGSSPYPPLEKVFKDDPTFGTYDNRHEEQRLPSANGISSPYPPVVQAFKDDKTTSSSVDNLSEQQSSGDSSSPYPSFEQAFKDGSTFDTAGK